MLYFHQQKLFLLIGGSGNSKILLFLIPILPTPLSFLHVAKGICKNLYLKSTSCFLFQLEQNLNFCVWFSKLCVIPAYFFISLYRVFPVVLCASVTGNFAMFQSLFFFLETLDFLFPLPKMLLLQIFSGFTQCSGASLNMTSQERLFLTTKGEVVSLFSLSLHSDMFSSYHLVCVITSSYICLIILCSWAPECKLHESKSAVFPVYHCIFSAQNLPEMQGKFNKYL